MSSQHLLGNHKPERAIWGTLSWDIKQRHALQRAAEALAEAGAAVDFRRHHGPHGPVIWLVFQRPD